jgi:hypothetical protein
VPLSVAASGVLGNDSDTDGAALSAALVSGPAHGTLTLEPDGSFRYAPAADYHGPDAFTYRAHDGSLSRSVPDRGPRPARRRRALPARPGVRSRARSRLTPSLEMIRARPSMLASACVPFGAQ